jgi:predicted SprT family Zn-dependent metalloprotease
MTVKQFAIQGELWTQISGAIHGFLPEPAAVNLLHRIADLPIQSSRAARSLGAYVSKSGLPVCIRLQFAQEPANLRETFMHELAHLCDHLCNQSGRRYRRAHGPHWRNWAKLLGIEPSRCGRSEALERLYQQRLKPVAICQNCGTEFRRTRRLNHRRNYFHSNCGGRLQPL